MQQLGAELAEYFEPTSDPGSVRACNLDRRRRVDWAVRLLQLLARRLVVQFKRMSPPERPIFRRKMLDATVPSVRFWPLATRDGHDTTSAAGPASASR